MFDDIPNIVNNEAFLNNKTIYDAAFSTSTGPLGRPLAMASLWINHTINGFDPWGYKLTNVGIHIITMFVVIFFIRQLISGIGWQYKQLIWLKEEETQWYVAVLSGVMWALHPINISSVLYVVQRMTAMSGLFSLLALGMYCYGRNKIISGGKGWSLILSACFIVFPLAVFSKENSLIWPVWVMLIEWLVFQFSAPNDRDKFIFKYATFFGLIIFACTVIWLIINTDWLMSGYSNRDFTLKERALTEARIVWQYVYWILFPYLNHYGLYHDDIKLSTSIFSPPLTILALWGWCIILGASIYLRKKYPWVTLAVLFFIGGHLIESTVLGLELVHEHRNYVTSLGLIALVSGGLIYGVNTNKGNVLHIFLITICVSVLFTITFMRSYQWASLPRLIWAHVQAHPTSARSNYEAGVWYYDAYLNEDNQEKKAEHVKDAKRYFSLATTHDSYDVSGLIGFLWISDVNGESITPENAQYRELIKRLESTSIGEAKGAQLIAWFLCYRRGECKTNPNLMLNVLDKVLANPNASYKVKGRLVHAWGIILLERKDVAAVDYLELAIKVDPREKEYWVALIQTLVASNALDKAKSVYGQFSSTQNEAFKQAEERLRPYLKYFSER